MGELVKREAKKPYAKPKLAVYGTIRELTKTVGTHGKADGGRSVRANKTHI